MSTLTVYPDADPESTSVDGDISKYQANQTWATIHDATSGSADSASAAGWGAQLSAGSTTDCWNYIARGAFIFDTSAIDDSATITAATIGLRGLDRLNQLTQSAGIYSSSPASNTALADADYNDFGTTLLSDQISCGSWSTTGYNTFTLNATGLTAISKTSVSKYGLRLDADAANTPPTWQASQVSKVQLYYADQTGTDSDPKLVITYTTGATAYTITAATGAYTETGIAAGFAWTHVLTAATGAYTETGNDASLLYIKYTLPAAQGTYLVNDPSAPAITATGMLYNRLVGAGTGTYAETGQTTSLLYGRSLPAATGEYTETGQTTGLLAGRVASVEAGSYTLIGIAAGTYHGYAVATDTGEYTLTGNAAGLTWNSAIAFNAVITLAETALTRYTLAETAFPVYTLAETALTRYTLAET